jgi:hypothetical protein
MARGMDYGVRQSKLVTRRILVETLRRLQVVDPLANYSYVGFGAHQFLDFDLVHRHLGLVDMTSIESDADLIARCHFNAPYRAIKVLQGTAGTLIPTLPWKKKAIVWLDYTQRLRGSEMADIENVALRLKPGSVLAVTLNCHPGADGHRREALSSAVGAMNVPIGTSEARLADWGLANAQREMVSSLLHKTLSSRADGSSWQQLLNIHYKDDARMQLIVGVIDHADIHEQIQACKFEDMSEASFDAAATVIEVPDLTEHEKRALNQKLPAKSIKAFAGLAQKDVDAYAKFYRWLDPAS